MSSQLQNGVPPIQILHSPDDRTVFAYNQQQYSASNRGFQENLPREIYIRPNYPPPYYESNLSISREPSPKMIARTADTGIPGRHVVRTPSPTPSEAAFLKSNRFIDWKALPTWRFWIRREWLWFYVIIAVILVIGTLVTIFGRQIIHWIQPTATKLRDLPGGWIIPIAIFFIISFPPLFGHDILAMLCGIVWGLWVGFAITAVGIILGDIGNYYAFKYFCHGRGRKLEQRNLRYACLAEAVREEGLLIAIFAGYTVMPAHIYTAIFAMCGMDIFIFTTTVILSVPGHFLAVYIGSIIEQNGSGTETMKEKIIMYVVLAAKLAVSYIAMWYVFKKMNDVEGRAINRHRKEGQAKLERSKMNLEYGVSNVALNMRKSDSDLTLIPGNNNPYQRWDVQGHAVGHASYSRFYEPTPLREPIITVLPLVGVQREKSVNSVEWDMGPDAYRMPTFSSRPCTPSGLANQARTEVAPSPIESADFLPLPSPSTPYGSPATYAGSYQQSPQQQAQQMLPPMKQVYTSTTAASLVSGSYPYLEPRAQMAHFAELPANV